MARIKGWTKLRETKYVIQWKSEKELLYADYEPQSSGSGWKLSSLTNPYDNKTGTYPASINHVGFYASKEEVKKAAADYMRRNP